MLHRARHLVAARVKQTQPFPRLAISQSDDASPRIRELGQPLAGRGSGERAADLRIMPTAATELELAERWDGLE